MPAPDDATLQAWLQTALAETLPPERTPFTVDGWAALTSGWANNIYRFDLRDATGTVQKLILKQFTVAAKAGKEALALAALGDAGYPVPRVLLARDAYIVMERLDGQPLWNAYEAAPPAEKAGLTATFMRLLLALQELDATLLDAVPASEIPGREIARLRADSSPAFAPVIDWLDANRVACARPVISHRDYHPWNVLLEAGGRAVVIDWDWEIADPRFDLAWMVTLMARSGFESFSQSALATYQALSGQPVSDFAYFEVLTTTRWLINVTRSLDSSDNLRGGADDSFRRFIVEPMHRARVLIEAWTGILIEKN